MNDVSPSRHNAIAASRVGNWVRIVLTSAGLELQRHCSRSPALRRTAATATYHVRRPRARHAADVNGTNESRTARNDVATMRRTARPRLRCSATRSPCRPDRAGHELQRHVHRHCSVDREQLHLHGSRATAVAQPAARPGPRHRLGAAVCCDGTGAKSTPGAPRPSAPARSRHGGSRPARSRAARWTSRGSPETSTGRCSRSSQVPGNRCRRSSAARRAADRVRSSPGLGADALPGHVLRRHLHRRGDRPALRREGRRLVQPSPAPAPRR